ncbi:Nucleoside diphosphate-linked moiety X motif 17 [Lamellibrachia satsuma]|nr:Nucleoside diphosphate-linked moiety X motif 17 [Lamellibrachia satsuma]
MATSETLQRVLVYIKQASEITASPASFTQSVLDALGSGNKDEMNVFTKLQENKLLISATQLNDVKKSVKIKRPSFCPIHNLRPDEVLQLPQAIRSRGIDVGAVTLLESCDGNVLLTRRASHLSIFPGVWVPPGGHVELGETLETAALRELKEETGLDISLDNCVDNAMPIIALWESAFPAMLSVGLPKRHHMVVYLYARLKPPFSSKMLNSQLKIDPGEVAASVWLQRALVDAIVATSEFRDATAVDLSQIPNHISATLLDGSGNLIETQLETSVLMNRMTGEDKDIERVSTGTKFCLDQWLRISC